MNRFMSRVGHALYEYIAERGWWAGEVYDDGTGDACYNIDMPRCLCVVLDWLMSR